MGWRERQKRPPTLGERFGYACVGLVSGGLLSTLVIFPLSVRICRLGHTGTGAALVAFGTPVAFTLAMALWGFISTKRMVEKLADWWETVIESIRSR